MSRNRHLRDGNNAVNIPDGVSLRLGSYGTLPTCNAGRENHIAVSGGVIYLCDGSAWAAVGTSAAGVLVVKEGGVSVDGTVTTLDFDASDFTISEAPEDEINISLNYGTSAGQPAEGNHTHLLASGATDVTASAAELNTLDGITASTAELNVLDGIPATLTATELGYVDGVTSAIQTQLNTKQTLDSTLTSLAAYNTNGLITQTAADTFTGRTLTAGSAKLNVTNGNGVAGNPTVDLGTVNTTDISGVTASAAELNILDGATLTVTELNYVDGVTSAIQTQLDGKVSDTGDTMTGELLIQRTTDANNQSLLLERYTADALATAMRFRKSRNAAVGHTVVQADDEIGHVNFQASDGSAFRAAARISAFVDGTPGAADMPGRLTFSTTTDGTASLTERMRIDNAGTVSLTGAFALPDGITAPPAFSGKALLYVDAADGDLKVKFADGVTKTLATDT